MMDSITSPSLILTLIISIPHVFSYNSNPVIAVTQGVIEKESFLPISIFWYETNFTGGNWLIVSSSSNKTKYTDYFQIDEYTGFHELPLAALEHGVGPDKYCAVIVSREGESNENSNCKSKIQWMYDLRDVLKSFTLRDLVIPGTHDSAAYTMLNDELLHNQNSPSHWILSQTKSIKTQLMDGIRYLDLKPRLINVGIETVFFISHNEIYLVPMADVVKQIREFMELSKDIVIVSFQGPFEGFASDEDHSYFMNYLELSFGNRLHARRSWTYTLSQFWTADTRLILSYNHDLYTSSHYMWPPIPQYWGDVQTINQLHSHLDRLHQNHASDVTPYAAMVAFTHSMSDRSGSLRRWAERLGRYIPRWYAAEWSSKANIIVVDHYQTSGIVDIAVQLNEQRAKKSQSP